MKKFFRNAAILAFGFGVAMTFTACHSGSDDNGAAQPQPATDVVVENTLYVDVAGASSVKYNGATQTNKSGNVYRFDNVAATGTLEVKGAGMVDQNIQVTFGNETEKYIAIVLYAAAQNAQTHTQNTSGTVTVVNAEGDETVESTDVDNKTTMTVPDDAPSGDYSIVFYTPATADAPTLENTNDTADEPVLGIDCEPSGTTFTTPVAVTTTVPEISNLNVVLKNGNDEAPLTYKDNGDEVTAQIPHFSSWIFMLSARLTGINTSSEVNKLASFTVKAGKNRKSYTRKLGYEVGKADNSLVGRYVKALYGTKAKTLSSSFSFTAPYAGTAEVTVTQTVRTYNFVSINPVTKKQSTFSVKVYGSAKPSVVVYPYTHSGGAN